MKGVGKVPICSLSLRKWSLFLKFCIPVCLVFSSSTRAVIIPLFLKVPFWLIEWIWVPLRLTIKNPLKAQVPRREVLRNAEFRLRRATESFFLKTKQGKKNRSLSKDSWIKLLRWVVVSLKKNEQHYWQLFIYHCREVSRRNTSLVYGESYTTVCCTRTSRSDILLGDIVTMTLEVITVVALFTSWLINLTF